MKCPRRIPYFQYPGDSGEDHFDQYDTCSYCGSYNPDLFMQRLEEGSILLGSTDKNYKVYITATPDSEPLPPHAMKFYFQHLNESQMMRFVELHNERKIKFKADIAFYVLPFFMKVVKE